MTTAQFRLAALIVVELLGGAYYLFGSRPQDVPPVPDLSAAHPLVADHMRSTAAAVNTPDDWAALGEAYVAYGYFPEGEACYRVAASRSPESAERAAEWAFALERVGDFAGANAAYERAVALGHPDAAGCWYLIGRNHLRTEDVAAARSAFEKAGKQPSARYESARLAVRDGNPSAAVPVLGKLMTEFPAAVQPPLLRHKIEALAASPLAAVFADRATRSPGRLPTPFDRDWKRLEDTYYRLGPAHELRELESLVRAGRGAEAEPRLTTLHRDGWEPSAADLLAEVAFQNGRPADAARILQDAIDRAGSSAHLLTRLGSAHSETGKPAEAAAAWERATHLGAGGETKDAWHQLANLYEKAVKTEDARRAHARAYLGAGHELFWAGKPADARPTFDEAVKFDARLAAAWYYLGETDRLLGRPDAARNSYRRCLEIDPDFGGAHAALTLLPPPR